MSRDNPGPALLGQLSITEDTPGPMSPVLSEKQRLIHAKEFARKHRNIQAGPRFQLWCDTGAPLEH